MKGGGWGGEKARDEEGGGAGKILDASCESYYRSSVPSIGRILKSVASLSLSPLYLSLARARVLKRTKCGEEGHTGTNAEYGG